MEPVVAPEGLREAKKRRTRQAIIDAAMGLFGERGFDAVTVAEIARVAGVSEKTVFNYFPAKEDLVFARSGHHEQHMLQAIRDRAPGTPLVEVFRGMTMAYLDRVEREPPETIVAVPRLVLGSRALQDRIALGWERESALLSPVVAQETGAAESDLVPAVIAHTLAWTHRMVFRQAFRRLIDGEDGAAVAAGLRPQAQLAYDQLAAGLAGYGVKR